MLIQVCELFATWRLKEDKPVMLRIVAGRMPRIVAGRMPS